MKCNHEKTEVHGSYCMGFTYDKLVVRETRKCLICGKSWAEKHTGHYVRDTEPEKVDYKVEECLPFEVR